MSHDSRSTPSRHFSRRRSRRRKVRQDANTAKKNDFFRAYFAFSAPLRSLRHQHRDQHARFADQSFSRFARQITDRKGMRFDSMITNPGRLTILTALCDEATQDFVTLRRHTQLTDGNLTTHARKLAGAGLIAIEKSAREGKPVTYITLTDEGRSALRRHIDRLTESVTRSIPVAILNVPREQDQGAWID